MVKTAILCLKDFQRDLEGVIDSTNNFIRWVNEKIETFENAEEYDLDIEEIRVSKKKRMPGEICSDERQSNALSRFRIKTFNRILDKIVQSMESRFSNNFSVCKDLAVLNPKNFNEIKDELRKDSSKILFKKLQKY